MKKNLNQMLVPDQLLILVNNLRQPLHVRNSFRTKIFLKRIIKMPYKKITLLFLSNPFPFNGQDYQKQKGPGTSDQLLFRLQKKFRKIPLLVMYNLTKFDYVISSGF